jgi:hypothetical protein
MPSRPLAGLPDSDEVTGHSVLSGRSERRVALSGAPQHARWREGAWLFTVFDRNWCLEVAADANDCRLSRLGSTENVAAADPHVIEQPLEFPR